MQGDGKLSADDTIDLLKSFGVIDSAGPRKNVLRSDLRVKFTCFARASAMKFLSTNLLAFPQNFTSDMLSTLSLKLNLGQAA